MFITKFSVEDWIGNQNKGSVEQAHCWQEIESAIRELDGHHKTLVTGVARNSRTLTFMG